MRSPQTAKFYFMAQANHAHQLRLMQMHEQLLKAQMEASCTCHSMGCQRNQSIDKCPQAVVGGD